MGGGPEADLRRVSGYALVVSSEAEAELTEARESYRAISPALERRFRTEVDAVIASVLTNPYQFAVVYKSFRRALLKRFPYFVVFTVFGDTVVVFGFIHVRRDPQVWQSRA